MRFVYDGDQEAVDLPALGITVRRGRDEVEVTGERAQEFLKRDDWRRTDAPKAKEPPPEEKTPVEPEPSEAEGGEG